MGGLSLAAVNVLVLQTLSASRFGTLFLGLLILGDVILFAIIHRFAASSSIHHASSCSRSTISSFSSCWSFFFRRPPFLPPFTPVSVRALVRALTLASVLQLFSSGHRPLRPDRISSGRLTRIPSHRTALHCIATDPLSLPSARRAKAQQTDCSTRQPHASLPAKGSFFITTSSLAPLPSQLRTRPCLLELCSAFSPPLSDRHTRPSSRTLQSQPRYAF